MFGKGADTINGFYKIEDVAVRLDVSKATACRVIKKIKERYGLSDDDLPIKACIPIVLFNDYYDFSDKLKKSRKEDTK